jgi:hypothetical protein
VTTHAQALASVVRLGYLEESYNVEAVWGSLVLTELVEEEAYEG